MPKIVAIDYGLKRCGIAETDTLQMMAFGLTAIETSQIISFTEKYIQEENPEKMIIGLPLNLQGNLNEIESEIQKFIYTIQNKFTNLQIIRVDERFTSKLATKSLLEMGKKKKQRQDKYLIDEVSATLILRTYLEQKNN